MESLSGDLGFSSLLPWYRLIGEVSGGQNMCGIVGYIGNVPALDVILSG